MMASLDTIRFVVGALCLLFCAAVTLSNAALIYQWYACKRTSSMLWFAGGIAGAAGLLILPITAIHAFWWVPLVVDIAGGPTLIIAYVIQVLRARNDRLPDDKRGA